MADKNKNDEKQEKKFEKRTRKERFEYHRAGEKRILALTAGGKMTQNEKDARSAGYMAHAREANRMYVWRNASDAEREAMKKLRADKEWKKLWALEKVVKDRAKAANA